MPLHTLPINGKQKLKAVQYVACGVPTKYIHDNTEVPKGKKCDKGNVLNLTIYGV